MVYTLKCVLNRFKTLQYIHLMVGRVTRSNKPVWGAALRATMQAAHQWIGPLVGMMSDE